MYNEPKISIYTAHVLVPTKVCAQNVYTEYVRTIYILGGCNTLWGEHEGVAWCISVSKHYIYRLQLEVENETIVMCDVCKWENN